MAISAEYSLPATINGFLCQDGTDADNAKRHIDPIKPENGPFNLYANRSASDLPPQRFDRDVIDSAPASAGAVVLGALGMAETGSLVDVSA